MPANDTILAGDATIAATDATFNVGPDAFNGSAAAVSFR